MKKSLKIGWLEADNKYHIAIISTTYYKDDTCYVCLCKSDFYISNLKEELYIWPHGSECKELLEISTFCEKCFKLHGKNLTQEFINLKLGVKNPFKL